MIKKILLLLAIAVVAFWGWQNRASLDPEVIRDWIAQFGRAGPFLYVLLYAINTVTLLPPIAFLSVTAGLAFGKGVGFFAIMAGALLGTTATFFISRNLGREFVERRLKGRFKSLDEKLEKRGFATVLFFRVIPIIPFEVLNYAAGLSKIKFREYFLATAIGFVPGVVVAVFFGDSLATIKANPKNFLLAIAAMAVLIAVPTFYLKFRKKPQHGTD